MSVQLTLFMEDSPVNPSAWQESKKGRTITGIFGLSFRDWSENLNQIGLSLKTYLVSCISQQTMFAGTWSVKTTRSGYGIMKLRLSEQNTDEKGFSLWRTPDAHCDRGASSKQRYEKKTEGGIAYQSERPSEIYTPNTCSSRCERDKSSGLQETHASFGLFGRWELEPELDRVAYGISNRVDRLRALGNAVVPQQAYPIFKAIMEACND